ncbi:protein-tyrosine phosphatase-like protein [Lipomyces japonicus]|uniref:protein-tyrosine phosphatase-like protein n=1 Tax=Lipomyces japonicus TaxID=56871 RepID=UPI0034D014B5
MMAEFLRSVIASPRTRHYDPVADTYLDLAYLDKNIIVCSMPTNEFPKVMYRNSLSDLRKLLDLRHGKHWHIWEFRAEGAGYEDSEFYNRVSHFPFPDHNPPPFSMIPRVVASLYKFLSLNEDNVAVLHCKAGKGRSGTMFCAYLIAQHHWSSQAALAHFTAKRMKSGFGEGVSILSQRRWIRYVESWSRDPNREYRALPVLVCEIRIFNPVKGLEIRCCGFKEAGQKIVTLYHFTERDLVDEKEYSANPDINLDIEATKDTNTASSPRADDLHRTGTYRSIEYKHIKPKSTTDPPRQGHKIILRPQAHVHVTADINITIEKKIYGPAGLSFLSATSYVWFNAFFEGQSEQNGGTFMVAWEEMDGFKGTKKRGSKSFDFLEVDWVLDTIQT